MNRQARRAAAVSSVATTQRPKFPRWCAFHEAGHAVAILVACVRPAPCTSLTCRNVGGSHAPGNHTAETALPAIANGARIPRGRMNWARILAAV
jgi:hypothetical protein